jgi:prepilin-type N-terminal cleavage/methylation domain-containing protein
MVKRQGFVLLEILMVVAIIAFIFYIINSSRKKSGFNQEKKKALSLETIDTTNYSTTLGTTR